MRGVVHDRLLRSDHHGRIVTGGTNGGGGFGSLPRPKMLLTLGSFDTPHMGHAAFLKRCESFADEVVVGLNSDRFIASYKGPPLFSFGERTHLIGALGYRVLENDGPGRELIEETQPDALAIGSDWYHRDYWNQLDVPRGFFEEKGITLIFVPYTSGISTTVLRARCSQ